MAPMKDGVTKAVSVSTRMLRRNGMSVRDTSQASGTPMPTAITARGGGQQQGVDQRLDQVGGLGDARVVVQGPGAGRVVVEAVEQHPAEGLDHQHRQQQDDGAEDRGLDDRHARHDGTRFGATGTG
ncbi:hypothetical protein ACIU1J_14890 [Azospirillum doebereinerae]|uniref:hypothetical protein n=1 Tax=Azospirillum doebereinerae TaxID=92933 RepID=UPI00384C826D